MPQDAATAVTTPRPLHVDFTKPWQQFVGLVNDFIGLLPNLILGAITLLVALMLSRYAANLVRAVTARAGQGHNVGLLLGRLATYVVMIVGVLVALSTVFPSFTANSLIQTLGIGGVAVGFAFKDIFQNFLAGIIIIVSRPFRIGDSIAVKGYEGKVEDIQTRATMIRTWDNQRVVIPNSTVFTQEVRVITAFQARRTEIEFSIDYGMDIERAKAAVLEVVRSVEGVDETPAPDMLTMNFGDSGPVLRLRYWVTPDKADILNVRDKVMSGSKVALDAAGIIFPTQTVVIQPPGALAETEGGSASGERWANGTNDS